MSGTIHALHLLTRLYAYEHRPTGRHVEVLVRHSGRSPVYVVRNSDSSEELTMNALAVASFRSRLMQRGYRLVEHHADPKIA